LVYTGFLVYSLRVSFRQVDFTVISIFFLLFSSLQQMGGYFNFLCCKIVIIFLAGDGRLFCYKRTGEDDQNVDKSQEKLRKIIYRITVVMKVETDIIASLTMYVETFKTNVIVFICNIIMCLTSHGWYFSVSEGVRWCWQYAFVISKEKCSNYQ
jgi:Na+/melibiose symporter-like transporter